LKEKINYKTKQGDLIVEYLKNNNGSHFSASDIVNFFNSTDRSIGVATIYRQLEKLTNQGKVRKYYIDENSPACYEYADTENCCSHAPCYHCKCEVCGKLIHLECHDIDEIIEHIKEKHAFDIDVKRMVLYGICEDCRKKEQTEE